MYKGSAQYSEEFLARVFDLSADDVAEGFGFKRLLRDGPATEYAMISPDGLLFYVSTEESFNPQPGAAIWRAGENLDGADYPLEGFTTLYEALLTAKLLSDARYETGDLISWHDVINLPDALPPIGAKVIFAFGIIREGYSVPAGATGILRVAGRALLRVELDAPVEAGISNIEWTPATRESDWFEFWRAVRLVDGLPS